MPNNSLLITLVSAQTIPNILCTDFFKPDAVLFISTDKMEKINKVNATLESIKAINQNSRSINSYYYNEASDRADRANEIKHYTIIVKEDSILDTIEKLSFWIYENGSKFDEFIINITLGTKIMSIALFEAMRQNNKTKKIVYMPIDENIIEIIPANLSELSKKMLLCDNNNYDDNNYNINNTGKTNQTRSISQFNCSDCNEEKLIIKRRLSLFEYCKAYDVDITNFDCLDSIKIRSKKDENFAKWIINNYFDDNFAANSIIEQLLSNFFILLIQYRNEKEHKKKLSKNKELALNLDFTLTTSAKSDKKTVKLKKEAVKEVIEEVAMKAAKEEELSKKVEKSGKNTGISMENKESFEESFEENKDTEIKIELLKKFFSFEKMNICKVDIQRVISDDSISNTSNIKIVGTILINKDTVDFLTGGWLEEFCFNEINSLKDEGIIDDAAINASLSKKNGTDNEIDVIFTSKNKIYMIECKSLQQKHDANSEIFYKIYSIQDKVGRLATKSFLVSTAADNILDKQDDGITDRNNAAENNIKTENCNSEYANQPYFPAIKDAVKKRANELNAIVINPVCIKNLKNEIKKYL